jgi:hypothetical protein
LAKTKAIDLWQTEILITQELQHTYSNKAINHLTFPITGRKSTWTTDNKVRFVPVHWVCYAANQAD